MFTFIDFFSGIGGFRIAFESLGGKSLGYSEINEKAISTYKENFNTNNEDFFGDISSIENIPYADIYAGGVPCQSWSVAGKKRGFDDPRGKLWFDTIKVTEMGKPKMFIYENVKGLADPRNKANLSLLIKEFNAIGYKVDYKVLNAFNFGHPQNRERVFLVGLRKDINKDFEFPSNYDYLPRLNSILDQDNLKRNLSVVNVDPSSSINSFNLSSSYNKGNFFTFGDTRNGDNTIHSWDLIDCSPEEKLACMTILKNRRKSKYGKKDGNPLSFDDINELESSITEDVLLSLVEKGILRLVGRKYEFVNSKNSAGINGIYRIYLPRSHVFSTLTRTGSKDYIATKDIPLDVKNRKEYFIKNIYLKDKYRKPTVREATRMQGFPDSFKFPVKDVEAFKLLGNSVPINVVREISKNLIS